ncbi:MAG: hypothetical protein LRZ84_12835 [Desertifilum sp.]|nr:hypothetical protein [Desertifilum sp.]
MKTLIPPSFFNLTLGLWAILIAAISGILCGFLGNFLSKSLVTFENKEELIRSICLIFILFVWFRESVLINLKIGLIKTLGVIVFFDDRILLFK